MESMTAAAPPQIARLPMQAMQQPAGSAIQPTDYLLSPAARKLREIETTLGQALESMQGGGVLAARIDKKLEERRGRRRMIEEEILDALHRYNGMYTGATRTRLDAQPNKSRLWVDLTRQKTDTAHADIMDVLRGPSGDKPWGLTAEEIPENYPIPPMLQQMGVTLSILKEEHKKRARGMETEIKNQLSEGDADEVMDVAVLEACIAGTSFVFGPYTVPDKNPRWETVLDPNLRMRAQWNEAKGYRPALRHAPVLNCYPDMEATNNTDLDMIEVVPLTRRRLMDMATEPGVNPANVLRVLRESPYGNYNPAPEIIQARTLGKDPQPSTSSMYELLVHVGEVTGQELREAGGNIPEEMLHVSVTAEIWKCGRHILRARRHKGPPLYHKIVYRKRGTRSVFGHGVPWSCRNSQDACNGAGRMIMDNAAIASGPIIELNTMLYKLSPGEDPSNVHGWKVYLSRHDGHSGKRALFVHQIPAYTEVFMRIIDLFRRLMDEESGIPAMAGGVQGGSTKTATGMSILDNNSNKMRNLVLRGIDDDLLEPLIEGYYDWNMRYSEKEWLLVPAKVEAKGTQKLMSREIETQRMLSALQIFMGHPAFKEDGAMRALFRALGLPVDDLVVSQQELLAQQQRRPSNGGGEQVARGPVPQAPGGPPVGGDSGRIPMQQAA